jgi:hypothetical protein
VGKVFESGRTDVAVGPNRYTGQEWGRLGRHVRTVLVKALSFLYSPFLHVSFFFHKSDGYRHSSQVKEKHGSVNKRNTFVLESIIFGPGKSFLQYVNKILFKYNIEKKTESR